MKGCTDGKSVLTLAVPLPLRSEALFNWHKLANSTATNSTTACTYNHYQRNLLRP